VLLQRVTEAKVTADDRQAGSIGPGLLLLVGISGEDLESNLLPMVEKIANLRIFEDADGRMNLSARDRLAAGHNVGVLVVSQFTLYGDIRKGRRPAFTRAAAPEHARPLIDQFASLFAGQGFDVGKGEFGAHMQVSLTNDGPVTIWIDSDEFKQPRRGNHDRATSSTSL
jgi:D-tyrosyl-tRNA(Tyr) deacylase